jgi:hypothetical protein
MDSGPIPLGLNAARPVRSGDDFSAWGTPGPQAPDNLQAASPGRFETAAGLLAMFVNVLNLVGVGLAP